MNRINLLFLAVALTASIAHAQSVPSQSGSNNNPSATNVNVVNTPTVKVQGQKPSNYVVLANYNGFGCPSWLRIDRTGNPSLFSIPNGYNLLITDMDFEAFNTGVTQGAYAGLQLIVGPYGEVVLDSFVMVDSVGTLATQQHLSTGIVMSVLPTCSSPGNSQQVTLRGYLIPAS